MLVTLQRQDDQSVGHTVAVDTGNTQQRKGNVEDVGNTMAVGTVGTRGT